MRFGRVLILLVSTLFCGCLEQEGAGKFSDLGDGSPGGTPPSDVNEWITIWQNTSRTISSDLGEPEILPVSVHSNWGDSIWLQQDAQAIFFMEVEGDALSYVLKGKGPFPGQPSIYKAVAPHFDEKLEAPEFAPQVEAFGDAGPMIWNGQTYKMSNQYSWENEGQKVDTDLYLGTDWLSINQGTTADWGNPHRCSDELWFDEADTVILKSDVAADGSFGAPVVAPDPINLAGAQSSQPWLTDDCQTMIFSSTRDGGVIKIFRSKRTPGTDNWSNPELLISSEYGVGEFSMSHDGAGQAAYAAWEEIVVKLNDPSTDDDDYFTTLFLMAPVTGNVLGKVQGAIQGQP